MWNWTLERRPPPEREEEANCLALLLFSAPARSEEVFKALADLPPLLQFQDGSEVKTAADLERRKREIAALLKRKLGGRTVLG